MKFFVVDDDPSVIDLVAGLLKNAGHEVESRTVSLGAVEHILAAKPDCVVIDLMMPGLDGLNLCKALREDPAFSATAAKIVVISSKVYEFDRKRALDMGADGYIVKPLDSETFVNQVEKIIEDRITVRFWGVRGTLPTPGAKSVRYGGNTSCVTVEFATGQFFIFDAGSGIKLLSDHLMATRRMPMTARIFISHPHWDHINALPFFAPLYLHGNEFAVCGTRHGDVSMREMISAQMDGVYFPITIKEFAARVYFVDLGEETFNLGGIRITTKLLNHPGNCLGYRIDYNGRSICYVTDNELYFPDHPHYNRRYEENLGKFVRGADVLITDVTYTDKEYAKKINWGHSCVSRVVDLAHAGGVKTLYLFHHDPDQSDAAIDAKLETARALLAERGSQTRCVAPAEGDEVQL